jgi:hypothetical protein
MDMRGPVIIGVDHDTQNANAKNRRHLWRLCYHKPKRLGICGVIAKAAGLKHVVRNATAIGDEMRPQMLIMCTGTILILCGIAMVGYQGYSEIASPATSQVQQQQQATVATSGEISVKTRFPGIELIAIGAVLQIVGYLGAQPWKRPPAPGDKP